MIVITRRYLFLTLLSSLAALVFAVSFMCSRDDTRLRTFRSEGGWGYYVTTKERIVIRQPFIPAVEGRKPFASRHDARKAGKIVLEKITAGKDPSVSADELSEAGIGI
jgi:hypothetical protein